MKQDMFYHCMPVGPLQCNCTIIGDPESQCAIVIDPGGDAESIGEILDRHNLLNIKVLHTHAHFDHFLASGELKKTRQASLALHREDKILWDNLEEQCRMYQIPYKPMPSPDKWIDHEEEIYLNGNCCGKALHTPGHTPGSMSFAFNELNLLVAGDTLFRGGVGRTDLWGGDQKKIEHSIKNVIYKLDESYDVITGHGPSTRIGHEMRSNPFVRA